jgi:hypothetical protein
MTPWQFPPFLQSSVYLALDPMVRNMANEWLRLVHFNKGLSFELPDKISLKNNAGIMDTNK